MSPEKREIGARIVAMADGLRKAAAAAAVELGGSETEGMVALCGATCFANAKLAHECAAEIAGRDAPDDAAILRDARILQCRFVEMTAAYFRERFGEGGGDVFDETLTLAAKTRAKAERSA